MRITLLLLFVASSMLLRAQESEWKLINETDAVSVYMKVTPCERPNPDFEYEFALLKFENKTDSDLKVEFDLEPYYNGRCSLCENKGSNPNEGIDTWHTIYVDADSSFETICSDDHIKLGLTVLYQFANFPKAPKLTALKVVNIQTTEKK